MLPHLYFEASGYCIKHRIHKQAPCSFSIGSDVKGQLLLCDRALGLWEQDRYRATPGNPILHEIGGCSFLFVFLLETIYDTFLLPLGFRISSFCIFLSFVFFPCICLSCSLPSFLPSLLTYLLTYLLTFILHVAESFLRS